MFSEPGCKTHCITLYLVHQAQDEWGTDPIVDMETVKVAKKFLEENPKVTGNLKLRIGEVGRDAIADFLS